MRGGNRIAAIIPVLNEAPSLALLLPEIPDWVDEIIVVDNGSTDGSAHVAQALG
ncbi:MAG: glycosyltransferase, partial [Sphingomonas sp.]|nr:glycosyltransferase [Sphingomonas sp.]